MKKNSLYIVIVLFLIAFPFKISSQVRLPKVFGNNMVLQQGKEVNVWGSAAAEEYVTVKFQKQIKKVKADAKGNWTIKLNALKATAVPQKLIVCGKKNKIVLKNILIGEVWLVSGQSNMEYSMNNHPQFAKPQNGDPDYLLKQFKQANNPNIRLLYVEKNLKTDTLPSKGWQMIDEKTLKPVSAIGYFFAKILADSLQTPVGFISASWGGTPIEAWTPEQAYLQSPIFKNQVSNHKLNNITISDRFDKMIKPLNPYSLKGVLWYQGETNVINGDREIYQEKMKLWIDSWRSLWKDDELPIYYVQLAPCTYSQRRDTLAKTWEALPYVWEAQTACMKIPHTGMVVTTDLVDNPKNIHPSYKWIIGERLVRWALANDYGRNKLVCCGPMYKRMRVESDKIELEFDHVGSGLITRDGKKPDWFYIKNEKGVFVRADANIENNKIIISRENVAVPVVIRFAWDEIAMPNLINKEGLPAIPFRTCKY